MITYVDIVQFLEFRKRMTVVDVRSPAEFAAGHMPGAVNIPLLNDEERAAVGTDFKKKGRLEAVRTGFRVMGPRLSGIVDSALAVASGKELLVHCWRGGMRSSYFARVAGMADIRTTVLTGGYKAYRHAAMEMFGEPLQLVVLSGNTGSGKTEVLQALGALGEQIVDLEALANHKGSVFGGLGKGPQPTTEQFQNDLFESLLQLDRTRRIWVEDESKGIGHLFQPEPFWVQKVMSPVVALQVDKSVRIRRLVSEYGDCNSDDFIRAMDKIEKRLGGQHLVEARDRWRSGDKAGTMEKLLTYYDKAYAASLVKKKEQVLGVAPWDGISAAEAAKSVLTVADRAKVYS